MSLVSSHRYLDLLSGSASGSWIGSRTPRGSLPRSPRVCDFHLRLSALGINRRGKTNVKDEQPKSTAGKPNVSAAKQKANKEADEDDDEESVY
ncbi:hypothetical protein OPV22_029234 [Ensete ventricosum]|uniref:Uncharacterized protein n=1 Tax=Ensete ventricosum TaxID=4639 RepID=A0AAV8P4U3_ENSVE|nr:hypothetical protein OPV22_029234 [Ensete ventricosum]